MIYRDYQEEMHRKFDDAWAGGEQNVLGVLPTGGGKGALIGGAAAYHDGPSCSIAHRQELVAQISYALCKFGVEHRIVAAEATVREIVRVQCEEFGRSFYNPRSPHGVASVDTLVLLPESDKWLPSVTKWTVDECFPAGTMVGDVPIELVRAGDTVPTFNEATGLVELGLVVRTFKSQMPNDMVRLAFLGHHVVTCTPGHPLFTRRGWVAAAELLKSDEVMIHDAYLPHLRHSFRPSTVASGPSTENWPGLLREGLQQCLPGKDFVRDYGPDEPRACIQTDDRAKSDAARGNTREGFGNAETYRAWAEDTWGEWAARNSSGMCPAGDPGAAGLCEPSGRADEDAPGLWVPDLLQAGLRECDVQDRGGSRWGVTQFDGAETAGLEKGQLPRFVGLDSVTVLKRGDIEPAGDGAEGSWVFNFEVAGTHTYLANGVVAHNCHHLVKEGTTKGSVNKWQKAVNRMPRAKGLGLTATPLRADGKGLGRHADGIMDVMIEGPEMRELIHRGYLTDYEVYCPPTDIDLSQVGHAPSGDYSPEGVRKAVHESRTIVGDVVASYAKIALGERGVTFCVDIESAMEVCAEYRRYGIPAEVLTGKTPVAIRAGILRRLRAGTLWQVVSVDVLSEGFDLPAIQVVSFVRPTDSLGLYRQQFGRVLRIMEGKTVAKVIDHVGNVIRHRPPDALRKWTLDRRERRAKGTPDDLIPMRACPQCTRPYEKHLVGCPYCGHFPEPVLRKSPEHVEGDLVLLSPETLARLRGEVDAPMKVPYGAGPEVVGALRKHHAAKTEAQRALREAMDQWGGFRLAAGEGEREQQKRFFLTFGVDVLTAQTLGAKEAASLRERVVSKYFT